VRFRRQKLVACLLIAVVAFASSGNVAIHRIANWHHCHCFEAIHAATVDPGCCCRHDRAIPPTDRQTTPNLSARPVCFIGHFFSQSADPSVVQPTLRLESIGKSLVCVDSPMVDASMLPAYWSRGPPMNG
jgi:hypothetical protein